jgi:hypothetical protein
MMKANLHSQNSMDPVNVVITFLNEFL